MWIVVVLDVSVSSIIRVHLDPRGPDTALPHTSRAHTHSPATAHTRHALLI